LLRAAGSGCIGAYDLGGNDLGSSTGIVGDSSSVNALLDNAVPLGDGNTNDRVGMDDEMSGAVHWRWPTRGWRWHPQHGRLRHSGQHRSRH
jgi:hypothetical protein